MGFGYGHPEFLMAVAPAVRQAHHTRHNIGADFDRRLDSAGASGDAGETALAQAKTFGIRRMKQDGAAVASLYQGRNIMQPGITGADMPPADQDMPPRRYFLKPLAGAPGRRLKPAGQVQSCRKVCGSARAAQAGAARDQSRGDEP